MPLNGNTKNEVTFGTVAGPEVWRNNAPRGSTTLTTALKKLVAASSGAT